MAIPCRLTASARAALDPSWLQSTFSDLWERNAKTIGEREALTDSRKRLTWSEANDWINQIADGLIGLGYEKDDRIVIQLPNCVELPLLRVACERAGLICFVISRALKGKEVEFILNKAGARMYICMSKFRDVDYFHMAEEIKGQVSLEHIVVVGDEVPPGAVALNSFLVKKKDAASYAREFQDRKCRPEEIFLIAHTTGTTGFPKFVENPIYSRMEQSKFQVERLNMTADDVSVIISPNTGGPNTFGYLASPLAGAKIVMIEHFDPEGVMQRIEREGITILLAVPTMVIAIVDHPSFKKYNLSTVRIILAAGAPFTYHEAVKAEAAFGCSVVPNYGSVDCGLTVMGFPGDPQHIRLNRVGKPLGRCELKLLKEDGSLAGVGEEGEIYVRGRDNVTGYFCDEEANRNAWDSEGWFRMGDLGTLDRDGYLAILGRKKDVIIRGGQNIIPGEVERFISQHPKVASVAIVGMADRIMGERVCAYIVPKGGAEITMEEINAFLKENRVAYYKLLERLEIIGEFPLVGDKVDKKLLVKDVNEKLERELASS